MAKSRSKNSKNNNELRTLLLIGIPIIIVMILAVTLYNASQPAVARVDDTLLIYEDSPTLGPYDAPVTIVEFLDPECEACRAAYPAIKQLLENYGDNVRLVVRYLPLHGSSIEAIVATEAAGLQGQYWEMQELLFIQQSEWGHQETAPIQLFIAYAEQLGLDTEQFVEDMQNPNIRAKIERDNQDAQTLGLTGTPSFFINGQRVDPLSIERMIEMIEAELG